MTIVLKLGGGRAIDPGAVMADVATLLDRGEEVIVVHGGSTAVDETLHALGKEPTYVETPDGVVGRFTDEQTMEVFEMVLPGQLNTDLVVGLRNEGVPAIGLSGVDGGLLTGPRKSAVRIIDDGTKKIKRGDHSGRIEGVNQSLLTTLLADGYVPVVTLPALGDDGGEWTPVNVDADRAAAAIAGAMEATLVVLTDVPGVLTDPNDETTLLDRVETPEEFDTMAAAAEGFMERKVMAIREALESGAPTAIIASATTDTPAVRALDGEGTHVIADAVTTEETT